MFSIGVCTSLLLNQFALPSASSDYWVSQQAVDEDSADAEFLDADRLAKTLKLGKKDAMYVSVIQQLLAKVETLEAKVAALEA